MAYNTDMNVRKIASFKILSGFKIQVTFDDGVSGIFSLKNNLEFTRKIEKELLEEGVFECAKLDPVYGFLEWPNGYDISPEFIYSHIS